MYILIYVKNIDVIFYSKITGQKGYAGQVTCRCEPTGEKKNDVEVRSKEKDFAGCCSKKAREAAGGCCMSGCCKTKNGGSERDSAGADGVTQAKDTVGRSGGCCAENRK
ncbi:PREDICTED: uncharacterized protein LOC105560402 isoform X2 [Vollenhovia emeryi]|uniref:uncharacterized protein LOC105560402 isoform X2 n=1 Tax=Vollenhovia emeryi TaxID=411798 RepID=UPI0005F3A202|nr:PREDICTED: uncharacterized protein LOC105560402 isoform X2 [Vollenhovia emeryi]